VAGIVKDGILPGFYGYETGQAAVGDAFDWTRRLLGGGDFESLNEAVATLPPGADGVTCVDWFNGCRTPLMDGALRGAFFGLTLSHSAAHVYRAVLEGSGYGIRWIVELLREHRVPVRKFVATGGLPHRNPLLIHIYADVLGEAVRVHASKQGPALGAALLGFLAAGSEATGFSDPGTAIAALTKRHESSEVVEPDPHRHAAYKRHYERYRQYAELLCGNVHEGKDREGKQHV
jgi:L-ribulokinase